MKSFVLILSMNLLISSCASGQSAKDVGIVDESITMAADQTQSGIATTTATKTEVVETKPVETKPMETKLVETKPAATKPTVTKPAVTKPAVTKPAVTKPAVTKPAATKPAVTKPAATKPAVTKPPATKPPATKTPIGNSLITTNPKGDKNDYAYIVNMNTKKFHYPRCHSVDKMNDENKGYSNATKDQLVNAGYSPCGNCRP